MADPADTTTNPAAVVEQVDRDAWEHYGPEIFYGDMTGPEALARHRLLGIEQGRAEMREEAAEVASEELENRRADQKRDMMSNFLRGQINAASRILDAIRAIPTAKERGE